MVHIVGAGPGAPDLITVRGKELISQADTIIYAGSLVNPALLEYRKEGCRVLNSAYMTLDQVVEAVRETEAEGKMTVRLHTGDPCIYGAIREQMDEFDRLGDLLSSLPGSQLLLWSRRSLEYGIHASGDIPERGDHQDGRADSGSGAGIHRFICGAWGDHGPVLKLRHGGRAGG